MPTYVLTQYPTDPPEVELIFPLAVPEGLDAVHTGVCVALKRLRPLRPIDHETVNGLTTYNLEYHGVMVQLFVIRVTTLITKLQIQIIGALLEKTAHSSEEPLLNPEIIRALSAIMQTVDEQVVKLLRQGVTTDDLKPPPPTGGEMRAIFDWQRIYHPDMTDDELAEVVHFSPNTIRNERSRLKYGKRLVRESTSFDEFARRHMTREQRDAYGY